MSSSNRMDSLEGQDIFADDFIRQEQILIESRFPSEIQKFFEGTNIFVTGGTGFLGKVLVEKLLRVCSKLNKIYLLIRPKKGKSVDERFTELFEGPLFDLLRKEHPNFSSKVILIAGDLATDGSPISQENRQLLVEDVNIIFHCAATVRFDEKLRLASNINVKATKFFLDMAHEMKNLKAFIHVSTAYANCPSKSIGEEFYPPPYDFKKLTAILDVLDDNILDKTTPELIGKWPNTYAFTKIIAEHVVKEYGKGLPIGILRPAIVTSTTKEPLAGWINNYYGPQGVVFAAALGLLRTLHCDPNIIADMVPVDFVINALIALAWDIGQTKGDNPNFEKVSWKDDSKDDNSNIEKSDEIPILNYVSSERNPITWGEFMHHNYCAAEFSYSPLQLWHSSLTLNKHKTIDLIYRWFCHYLPALIIDAVAFLIGKKPLLFNAYKKIHKFSGAITYFCTSQWKFKDDKVVQLWGKMTDKDRLLFNFDIEHLDWSDYFMQYLRGIRVYLVHDEMNTVPEGRRRAKRLKFLHYTLVTAINLFLLYILWLIFSPLFS